MPPQKKPDELRIKQVVTYKDAAGNDVRPEQVATFEAPQETGNINYKGRYINFSTRRPLLMTAEGGTADGVTTTVTTFLTYRQGKTRSKSVTVFTDKVAVITAFEMGEFAEPGVYGYTATFS